MRILLAEDEKELREALAVILKHSGYSVDTVDNGEDALGFLMTGLYDGAILDIMMPKMDGLCALKKAREAHVDTPVLILTAKTEIVFISPANGIPTGNNDILFERFFRHDNSRSTKTGSHGIGLASAKAIIDAHKGKISIENPDGYTFMVKIIL